MCKNELLEKKLFFLHKSVIYFVDKLNIRDFNLLTVLKLIFIYESCAFLLQNSLMNVMFQL